MEQLTKLLTPTLQGCPDVGVIDQLHHYITTYIMLGCALLVGVRTFTVGALDCWYPNNTQKHFQEHVNTYCWTHKLYKYTDPVPSPISSVKAGPANLNNLRNEEPVVLNFYRWITVIYIAQATMFWVPRIIWIVCNKYSGIQIEKLVSLITEKSAVTKNFERAAMEIRVYLTFSSDNIKPSDMSATGKVFCNFWCQHIKLIMGMNTKICLLKSYFMVKIVQLVVTGLQVKIMTEFLEFNYFIYGGTFFKIYEKTGEAMDNEHFPRLCWCYFHIDGQGGMVRCLLTLNMLLGQLFLIEWFWLVILFITSFYYFAVWLTRVIYNLWCWRCFHDNLSNTNKKNTNSEQSCWQTLRNFYQKLRNFYLECCHKCCSKCCIELAQCIKGHLDVLFLFDCSSNIDSGDFNRSLQFAGKLALDFQLGPDKVQVGAASFSDNPSNLFNLNKYSKFRDLKEVKEAILNSQYLSGTTRTYLALENAQTIFDQSQGGRTGARKVVVLFTNGRSDDADRTQQEALRLKNSGVFVIVVGLSNSNTQELQAIASNSSAVFNIDDFNGGLNFLKNYSNIIQPDNWDLKFMKKYLSALEKDGFDLQADKQKQQKFVLDDLGSAGVFILRIMAANSNEMVMTELVKNLWKLYMEQQTAEQGSAPPGTGRSDSNSATEVQVQTNSNAATEVQVQTNSNAATEVQVQTNSNAETEVQVQTNSNVATEVKVQSVSNAATEVQGHLNSASRELELLEVTCEPKTKKTEQSTFGALHPFYTNESADAVHPLLQSDSV